MNLPTLDVAVCTYLPEGILQVGRMLPPPEEGIRFVVSWQSHADAPLPPALLRDDVVVSRLEGKGLSRNRNNALANCSADIVLVADDDVAYLPGALRKVREAFAERPGMDLAMFRADYPCPKAYPATECVLSLPFPKGWYAASIEMAFRRESVGQLRFNTMLGIGAPRMTSGEDEWFLIQAVRRGLDCRFIPATICRHPSDPTGAGRYTPGTLMASGFIISEIYPFSSVLRIPLKAWRVSRQSGLRFPHALRWLCLGALDRSKVRKNDNG